MLEKSQKLPILFLAGLSNYDVDKLCNQGIIERIKNGFYQPPKNNGLKEEQLIATLLPQGVVCIESALFRLSAHSENPTAGLL